MRGRRCWPNARRAEIRLAGQSPTAVALPFGCRLPLLPSRDFAQSPGDVRMAGGLGCVCRGLAAIPLC